MSEVSAEIEAEVPIADAWRLYFEPELWPAWVDGFGRVERADGYPEVGGVLVWSSNPAGRGRVAERVLAHEDRRLHVVSFEDPSTTGTLEVRFEMAPAGAGGGEARTTRISQQLSYALRDGGPLSALTDRLFIRGQMRGSLERSLADLRGELLAAAS